MRNRKYIYYFYSILELLFGIKHFNRILGVFLGFTPSEPFLIELRKTGFRFRVRSAMDIWSVKETFLDRFYEKFGTKIQKGWIILDIGGGIGDFTIFAASHSPENQVHVFEPTPDSFTLLEENLQLNRIKNVRAYPMAIWSKSEEITMDISIHEPVQFTSQSMETGAKSQGNVAVPGLSLVDAFHCLGITNCNLLKIDCEGAEFEILFQTPDTILHQIERIVMEYHDNATSFTHHDLIKFLAKKGFTVKTYVNYVHPYLGYLYASRQEVDKNH